MYIATAMFLLEYSVCVCTQFTYIACIHMYRLYMYMYSLYMYMYMYMLGTDTSYM